MRDDSLPHPYPTATSRLVRIVAILTSMTTTNETLSPDDPCSTHGCARWRCDEDHPAAIVDAPELTESDCADSSGLALPGAVCARCDRSLTAAEQAMAWPVTMSDGDVCPDCYGAEAYCADGHLLRGDTDSDACGVCNALSELTAETITDDQICGLADEAGSAGDREQVQICAIALHGANESPELGLTECDARQVCADAINAARAQETK